jgi:hypothetical protein
MLGLYWQVRRGIETLEKVGALKGGRRHGIAMLASRGVELADRRGSRRGSPARAEIRDHFCYTARPHQEQCTAELYSTALISAWNIYIRKEYAILSVPHPIGNVAILSFGKDSMSTQG